MGSTVTIRRMKASTSRRLAHGLWMSTVTLWILALILILTASPTAGSDTILVMIVGVTMATYASVGALVARTSPGNPVGWLLSAVGFAVALWMFGLAYAQVGFQQGSGIGTLPVASTVAWIAALSLIALLPVALPGFLLYFPDGHLRSRRWRPVLWATLLAGALLVIGALGTRWNFDPVILDPPGWVPTSFKLAYGAGVVLVIGTAFAGLLALILRFRETSPEQRQPLRMLVGMLAAMALATALALVIGVVAGGADWGWLVLFLAILVDGFGVLFGIPLAAAAAVLTFGLYDVGVVVKKTVVYVLLVGFFLLLLGLLSLILNPASFLGAGGGSASGDAASRIVTAGAVTLAILAIGFRPAKRLARRIVYGRRSTPYEAMSEFSERLGETYSTDDVLPRMASIVRASTGADVARVWLHVGPELRPVASSPPDAAEPPSVPVPGGRPPDLEGSRVFPVRDRGELLGALTVAMPPAEPLSKTGEQLVTDLAGQAGLVLRNVRLIEELQESRRRIVTAQDERARKLERDIHDGAQQQLVALSVKLGLAEQLASRDPEEARAVIGELKAEATDALDTLRDLARGIYPPLLADQGLGAALGAQARKSPVEIRLEGDGLERYAPEIEAAVYFCCLEAMQNVAKYANATSATIRLARSDGHLTFEVADDGAGFDPTQARGSGLTNMRDRLEALGGSLRVEAVPDEGTRIRGRIPVEAP